MSEYAILVDGSHKAILLQRTQIWIQNDGDTYGTYDTENGWEFAAEGEVKYIKKIMLQLNGGKDE